MRLVLAVLLALQVSLVPETFGWPCPEDDGDCPPDCSECATCGHGAVGDALAEPAVLVELDAPAVPESEQRPAPSPDPADILHVPIVRSA